MESWLQLLDDSVYRDSFVLRGGLLMDTWIPVGRAVNDLDLLGLGSLEEADEAVRALCSAKGEERFEVVNVEKTWEETVAPGLRYQIGPETFQLDIATGDPLAIAPTRLTIGTATVLCCAPEIMYGWKIHGLFERGEGRWKARDLYDLYLLQTRLELDPKVLDPALEIAFTSRNTSLAVTNRFFEDAWGQSSGSKKKWAKFRNGSQLKAIIPENLHIVKDAIADKFGQILLSINAGRGNKEKPI